MENNLGIINNYHMYNVQRKLVNAKLSLLDETFTFNLSEYNFEYLVRLHKYLFCDFYNFRFDSALDFPKDVYDEIEEIMRNIRLLCVYAPEDKNTLLEYLHQIWEVQAFNDGNTRTILGLLKVLNEAFNLGFKINLSKEMPTNFMEFNKRMCLVDEEETKLTLK